MTDRKDYIEALRAEREHVANLANTSPSEVKARQAQIDSEIDHYSDKPAKPRRETAVPKAETAVPGPISRARASAARKTK